MGIKISDLPPHLQKRLTGKKLRQKQRRPEQELQIGIFNQLRGLMIEQDYKHFIAFHVPNGGYRTKVEAQIFQAMGTMPGVADIVFLFPRTETRDQNGIKCFSGNPTVLFVELKFGKSGRVTENQSEFGRRIKFLGFDYYLLVAGDMMDALQQTAQILHSHGAPVGLHPSGRLYTVKKSPRQ